MSTDTMPNWQKLPDEEKIDRIKSRLSCLTYQLVKTPSDQEKYFVLPKPDNAGNDHALITAYDKSLKNFEKAKAFLSTVHLDEGCICESCTSFDFETQRVPTELEPLIVIARKEAEEKYNSIVW